MIELSSISTNIFSSISRATSKRRRSTTAVTVLHIIQRRMHAIPNLKIASRTASTVTASVKISANATMAITRARPENVYPRVCRHARTDTVQLQTNAYASTTFKLTPRTNTNVFPSAIQNASTESAPA